MVKGINPTKVNKGKQEFDTFDVKVFNLQANSDHLCEIKGVLVYCESDLEGAGQSPDHIRVVRFDNKNTLNLECIRFTTGVQQ